MVKVTEKSLSCTTLSDRPYGCLDACRNCSGVYCCGVTRRGGSIEPPFLTRNDIQKIEHFTAKPVKAFADARLNPCTGNTVFFLKTNGSKCVFFNSENGRCQVYGIRPIDCLLFPLDIVKIKKQYFWILYNYKYCNLEETDRPLLLSLREWALPVLADEIHEYATIPVPGMSKLPYEIISEIRLRYECV
jgi:Fe-S-cluster containining protein